MTPSEPDTVLDLRRAGREDLAAVVGLWTTSGLVPDWRRPREEAERVLAADNGAIFLGTVSSQPVATVTVGHDGRRGWLADVAVHPNRRHQGYGLQMVRAAELWLSERGLHRAHMLLRTDNRAGLAFFKALGYTVIPRGVIARWLDRPPLPPDEAAGPDDEGKLDVTITYLEMTERPAAFAPHPPLGQRAALMRAESPTVSFYRYLYNTVGEPWLWWERRALDDAALARIVQDERVEIYVLYVDGVPAGFAELDRRHAPVTDIRLLGLIPEFKGRGLGGYLLRTAVDIAWAGDPETVTVDTCTLDEPRALPLYQRIGFTPVRRETRRIDDPRVTGLIPVA